MSYSKMTEWIREALSEQAEVEPYGEGTVTITGPIDLDEVAKYCDTKLVEVLDEVFVKAQIPWTDE